MKLEFAKSAEYTLGVELELQLLNLHDFNLTQDASELLANLAPKSFPGVIKPEITQSMIELNTGIHSLPQNLEQELVQVNKTLTSTAHKLEIGISGGGTHPFQRWRDQQIFPTERFESLYHLYGYLAKEFTVFGQHIHIGCKSGDDAIKLCHGFAKYIPHLIALSASSPFYQQIDTGFASARLNVISSMPSSGTIPELNNWVEFEEYFDYVTKLQIIKSIKDLYWDIRPKPEFGTVEIRVCDTPLTIHMATCLAAYAQAIAAMLIEESEPINLKNTYIIYKYNKFQALRFGLNGNIIDPSTEKMRKLDSDILHTLEKITPYAKQFSSQKHLEIIRNNAIKQNNDATWLREQYAIHKNLPNLVQQAMQLWITY